MTLTELEAIPEEVLTCAEVAPVLMVNPQSIRLQAAECPERLGFPVICIGSRTLIPKEGFLYFMRGYKKGPAAGTTDPNPYEGERT